MRTFKWLPRNKGYQLTFGLADVPFYYNTTSGPAGQLGGTWEWMDVHAIGKKETYMLWNIHACFSSAYGTSCYFRQVLVDLLMLDRLCGIP